MDAQSPEQSPIWTISMDDIEELQEEANAVGWDVVYTQYEAGSLDGTLTELKLPGLWVVRETYGRGFFVSGGLPKDYTPAMMPLSTKGDVRLNGLPYAPGNIFIPGEMGEFDLGGPKGIDLVTLHVEPESKRDLAAMLGQTEFEDILSTAMVHLHGAPQRRAAFEALLMSVVQDDLWASGASVNRALTIRDRIVEGLAALLQDAQFGRASSRRGRPSNRALYARQAQAYLEANLDRAVSLAELCRATGISAPTLSAAFREHYGVTPQVYHRSRRLIAVQRSLRRHWANETTVTEAAFDHGFWHLGRFSQAYKRRFGETPSQTLMQAPVFVGPISPFSYRVKSAA